MSLPRLYRLIPALAALALCAAAAPAYAQHDHAHHGQQARLAKARSDHPEPRANVTAADVLRVDQLENERQREAYEIARKIPHILDGLFCHCHCHEVRAASAPCWSASTATWPRAAASAWARRASPGACTRTARRWRRSGGRSMWSTGGSA